MYSVGMLFYFVLRMLSHFSMTAGKALFTVMYADMIFYLVNHESISLLMATCPINFIKKIDWMANLSFAALHM